MKAHNSVQFFPQFLLALGLALLSGCAETKSSKVDQTEIFPSYTAKYDAGSKTLKFNAEFRVGKGLGGTYVRLDKGSKVRMNGVEMRENTSPANQVTYDFQLSDIGPERLGERFEFHYVDNEGRQYRNSVKIPLLVNAAVPRIIQKSVGAEIPWSVADSLTREESVGAVLRSREGDRFFLSTAMNASSGRILLSLQDLAQLTPGMISVVVCRKKITENVSAATVGGQLVVSSCTATAEMDLRE